MNAATEACFIILPAMILPVPQFGSWQNNTNKLTRQSAVTAHYLLIDNARRVMGSWETIANLRLQNANCKFFIDDILRFEMFNLQFRIRFTVHGSSWRGAEINPFGLP